MFFFLCKHMYLIHRKRLWFKISISFSWTESLKLVNTLHVSMLPSYEYKTSRYMNFAELLARDFQQNSLGSKSERGTISCTLNKVDTCFTFYTPTSHTTINNFKDCQNWSHIANIFVSSLNYC